jgi:hypothetical protein
MSTSQKSQVVKDGFAARGFSFCGVRLARPPRQGENMATAPKEARLSLWTKLVFGSGDWSASSFGTLRQIFYAIFITDVVGLEPRLASVAALIGII